MSNVLYAFGGYIKANEVKPLHTKMYPLITLSLSEGEALLYARNKAHEVFPIPEYANHNWDIVGLTKYNLAGRVRGQIAIEILQEFMEMMDGPYDCDIPIFGEFENKVKTFLEGLEWLQ